MQYALSVTRKPREVFSVIELGRGVHAAYLSIVDTEHDITVHLGRSPAEPICKVRKRGAAHVMLASQVTALCVEWDGLGSSDIAPLPTVLFTIGSSPIRLSRDERWPVPFGDAVDLDFFSLFGEWRIAGRPPDQTPAAIVWSVLSEHEEGPDGPRSYPPFNSAFTPVARTNLPAVMLYGDGGHATDAVRLTGDVANGLDVDVTRLPAIAGAVTTTPARVSTFSAVFRLATRPYALANAFGAAGRKQYATIYKTSGQAVTARLISCRVALKSASAVAIVVAELVRLSAGTAPATGNPAITAQAHLPSDAPLCTTLALPTTAGSEGNLIAQAEWNLGVTGAGSAVNPPPPQEWVELLPATAFGDPRLLEMRNGNNEGFAVTIDCGAPATIAGYVAMTWTEE